MMLLQWAWRLEEIQLRDCDVEVLVVARLDPEQDVHEELLREGDN